MNDLRRNGEGYVDETAYKALLNVQKGNKMEIYRGDIFFVRKGGKIVGSEQGENRPCVIVSNNTGNYHSSIVEVVPLTTAEKKPLPTHVEVMCHVPSTALCECIQNVSKERLGEYIRSCTDAEMDAIDKALMVSLGLEGSTFVVEKDNTLQAAQIDELRMKLEGAERMLAQEKTFVDDLQRELGELADEHDELQRMNEILKNSAGGVKKEDAIRIETERDMYKNLYEQLFERMVK